MNRTLIIVSSVMLLSGSLVFAATPTTPKTDAKVYPLTAPETGYAKQPPACQKILQACDSAGYHYGDHQIDNKGLWMNCFNPTMQAGHSTVPGVTVTKEEVDACKAARGTKPKTPTTSTTSTPPTTMPAKTVPATPAKTTPETPPKK